MKYFFCLICLLLSTGAAARAEEEAAPEGFPVLPAEALQEIPLGWESFTELKAALAPSAAITWAQEIVSPELSEPAAFAAVEVHVPRFVIASLTSNPLVQPEGELPMRDCAEVKRERWKVKKNIERVTELRNEIDRRIARIEVACAKRHACHTPVLDARVEELRGRIGDLLSYADREKGGSPDRILEYRFKVGGLNGPSVLAKGYLPSEGAAVTLVRFHAGNWFAFPAATHFSVEGFGGDPQKAGDDEWVLRRHLTASQACLRTLSFGLNFTTTWVNAETQDQRIVEVRARAFNGLANP